MSIPDPGAQPQAAPHPVAVAEPALRWRPGRVDPLTLATLPGLRQAGVVTVRGWSVVVSDPVDVLTDPAELDWLAEACGWRAPAPPGGPPFLGGAVGYVADDVAAAWLALPEDPRPARAGIAGLWMAVHDTAVCIAPDETGVWLVAAALPGWTRRPAKDRLDELESRVAAAEARPPTYAGPAPPGGAARVSLDAPAHRAGVERIAEWIAAGDLYQLNLTLQIATRWRAPGALLAHRLWGASPHAAHAAWLDAGPAQIVSISPETFVRTDGDHVQVRPIKGTRPRSDDAPCDAAAARALAGSAKDLAEHVMIVDLERNDLGRVCTVGSVRVPELAALEGHPTVWHLTSTVTGRLRADVSLSGLLAACFPCGSVTGAPKRMAVARIRQLEPVRRGVYCGALGVVSRGLIDLSVAIRTAVLSGGVASYGTGGGIVADSQPAAELAEAMDKAAAFLTATGTRRPF